ncbi:unnamed protein product [Mytilus coruscus]|uniref:Uncharacterized protein n=1 Tax=Mytilus coruscus TaxID=42192 RepID=A0A6J8ECN1_MYTCO|nr:unnamed protein product [Mytilus coruscus]
MASSGQRVRKRPLPSYFRTDSPDEENNSSSASSGDTTSGPSVVVPKDVSNWTVFHLGKLGIFYDQFAKPTPSDVLQKVADKTGDYGYLTKDQQEILDVILEHLDFNVIIEKEKLKRKQYLKGEIINELHLTADKIQNQLEHGSNPSPSHDLQSCIRLYKRSNTSGLQDGRLQQFRERNGPEAFYTLLMSSFARLCHLTPVPGQLYETTLQIAGVKVTSTPDLVLEKNEDITFHSVSSIVTIEEVKKASVTAKTVEREGNEDNEKADIQHWLKFVPGMISVGTKIYFTLLHINSDHVAFLGPGVKNMKEVRKQKATVYYSEPKDILVKDDRNALIQSMMRLNNYCIHLYVL